MTVQQLIERLQKIKYPENTLALAISEPSTYETISDIDKTVLASQAEISILTNGKYADAIVLVLKHLQE